MFSGESGFCGIYAIHLTFCIASYQQIFWCFWKVEIPVPQFLFENVLKIRSLFLNIFQNLEFFYVFR